MLSLLSSTPRSSASVPSASKAGYGIIEPRICNPPPLRDLGDPAATLGHAAGEFARAVGQEFLPHEQIAADHLLEIEEDGGPVRFRQALLGCLRQNSKTHFSRVIASFRMLMAGSPQEVLGVSQDLSQSWYALELCQRMFRSEPWLWAEVAPNGYRRANGQQSLTLRNGSRYSIRASNAEAGRGLTCHLAIFDELRTQIDTDGIAAVSSTLNAARNGQLLMLSNAGSDRSVVLNNTIARGIAAGPDSKSLTMIWTPPPEADPHHESTWMWANPACGYGGITVDNLRGAHELLELPDFLAEVLNTRVVSFHTGINPDAWAACLDPTATLKKHKRSVAACFDSWDGHSVLAAAARLEDGRIAVELVRSWDSDVEARQELPRVLDEVQPRWLGWYPAAAAAFAPVFRPRRGVTEIGGQALTEACEGFAQLVEGRQIRHPGDTLLNAHVLRAEKRTRGQGWIFGRTPGQGPVTAAYSAAGAVHIIAGQPHGRARIHIIP